jgi:hypothetical protein
LNPRYVQEWLGVMTTAEIVELSQAESGENQYYLPKSCGDLITRRAGNSNLGVYTQEIPLLTTCAMEAVIDGFVTGEGVSAMTTTRNFRPSCLNWPMPNTVRFW